MPIKDTDLAWAAGIIDGEGSINLLKMKRKDTYGTGLTFDLRIDVGNTDPRMLVKLKTLFGGSISKSYEARKNRKACACWHVHAENASKVLTLILPYLCIKREQAEVAILSRQYIRHDKRCTQGGIEKAHKMVELSQRLKDLKHELPSLEEALCLPQVN